ncbi:ABC-2 type transport system ATP-binding protein [Georgenia satyanarayanai]|uniref:ABC-2 type transport system ATP-binding protein n=1 Tax=Georgenia satyanarayanai TaxID=860221 RepID=A0A2Y9C7Q0_9MICO|nr:ATP-binding cassette domain-containing protein [Georgenia satyanarayanai]PYF97277.1 ABC-2 type transport system ATP-binding protein [Georgenia satyanarayanai]SSA46363.1 ABC-2 type transport system ATP-binding protein [Georgenia satyanarayanai]
MTELAVETHGLTKRFGRQLAVDDLDLAVPRGAVFGFLGPNGSGKTTTIRIVLGLAAASAGSVRVLGHDMPKALGTVLPRVGALVEGPAAYPFLSGEANLRRLDAADRHASPRTRDQRVVQALERVGLSHAGAKRVRAYSLGMKQRLGIAAALLRPRDLLVLDEPTNGLDPQGTREVRSLVRSLADGGTTVVVSSHLLAEIEQICTHAAVMRTGRLVAQGSLDELRGLGRSRLRVLTPDPGRAREELARLGLAVEHEDGVARADGTATVRAELPDEPPLLETLAAALVAADVRLRGFEVEQDTLEDRFVALTGEGFDVAQ